MGSDIETLLKRAVEAETLRIFLDYDGTLAAFAPTPDTILPDQKLIALIKKMVHSHGVLPAVISGRRLAHIQKLLPVKGLLLGGTYGIEMQLPDGQLFNILSFEEVRASIEPLIPLWKEWIGKSQAIYLEDKGWALALHNRITEPSDQEPVLLRISKMTEEIMPSEGFRLSGNERFLEIAPIKANKAEAVKLVLSKMTPSNALVFYFGDDDKDEEAFRPVLDAGGFTIRIMKAPVQTKAQVLLKSPEELRGLLDQMVNARQKRYEK